MFDKPIDDRLSAWAQLRAHLDTAPEPLQEVWEFWQHAPYIPYNKNIDHYHKRDWPTPWELIQENKYDDFTKAVMIGWTLKYSNRYKNSKIELRQGVDKDKNCAYNIVCVDERWVINYSDNGPVSIENLPDPFYLENLIELTIDR